MGEKEIVREVNALTIMPLPVRIPGSWYELLPKVLPLVKQPAEQTRFYMPDEIIQMFLRRWSSIFIRRDGAFVWLHLGGVACYEVIPNFVKGIKYLIDGRDREITQSGGMQALLQRWRRCIEELGALDDDAVLKARGEALEFLRSERWHEELGKDWKSTAEMAHENFGKIRPSIKKWIAKYEERCNLDEPFGGRLSGRRSPAEGGALP